MANTAKEKNKGGRPKGSTGKYNKLEKAFNQKLTREKLDNLIDFLYAIAIEPTTLPANAQPTLQQRVTATITLLDKAKEFYKGGMASPEKEGDADEEDGSLAPLFMIHGTENK